MTPPAAASNRRSVETMDERDQDPTVSIVTPVATRNTEFRPGDRIADRYVIVQFLARGGMGEVYEALDEHLQGKRIALKTLRAEIAADPEMQARFEREVLVAREISHRAICPTWDLIRAQGPRGTVLCLSMRLLRGEPLAARLRRSGPMTPETALPIALQLAAGLDAAHEAGVIHRDFKSANVILENQGTTPVITDFGLSRIYDADVTIGGIGAIAGTPGYIAPEIFQGRTASPASDVYAFGIVLYEMLAGARPVARNGKPDLSGLAAPDDWKRVIEGCLAEDPASRFQSAGEAVGLLDSSRTRPVAPPPGVSRPAEHDRLRARRYRLGGLAALAALLLAAIGWFAPGVQDILHPLPARRFVALAVAPESAPSQAVLAGNILTGIHDRLVRSESRVKDLLIAGPAELTRPNEDPEAVGANMILSVTLDAAGTSAELRLRALGGPALRQARVQLGPAAGSTEAVAAAAARMLGLPADPEHLKDEDELAALPAPLYPLYAAAEELRRQPNDAGLEAAIEKYQRVLETAPQFALGYARIAQAYTRKYQLGHDSAVLAIAERNADLAVRLNPDSPSAVLSRALMFLYSGRAAEALAAFHRVLQLDPGNAEVLLFQAAAYRDSNRLADEEATCRLVIRQRPNYYRAYNALGMSLYREGHYEESAASFQQATQIAPRQALPYNNLGMAYLVMGRKADAASAFHASLERAQTELAWLNLGNIAFEDRNYRQALEFYGKARDLKPSDDKAWRNIADCYAILGNRPAMLENYAKAAEVMADFLRTNPRRGAAWMSQAFYTAKLGRAAESEKALRTAESAGASSLQDQFTKAQTLAVLGHKAEAATVLAECVRRGLSPVEIELALDLKDIRETPEWKSKQEYNTPSPKLGVKGKEQAR